MKTRRKYILFLLLINILAINKGLAKNDRTPAFATEDARQAVLDKIDQAPWAAEAYAKLKADVDRYVAFNKNEPHWLASRLFMHWQSHATTTLILDRRWAGAEGNAPAPTPHFDGSRDWATPYRLSFIAQLKPYNEKDGKIWLEKKGAPEGQGEWADPGQSGEIIGATNVAIMDVAAKSAFLYWITKDEYYANMAADVLWTYAYGYSFTTSPKYIKPDGDPNQAQWLGATSFEVIRDSVLPYMAQTYDYLYPYLTSKSDYDTKLIQTQMKRIADRIIEGGSRIGNWNIKENYLIAYASQVLDSDASFEDKRGREYYTNIVLNADLPAQQGINLIIKNGFDKETGVFPEAAGYSFDTTTEVLKILSLLAGRDEKIVPLSKMAYLFFAQQTILYPNNWSVGLGDSSEHRIDPAGAELLLNLAVKEKDKDNSRRLADFIQEEIAANNYKRTPYDALTALMQYVPDIGPYISKEGSSLKQERVSVVKGLDLVMQRNIPQNDKYALAMSIYGSKSGGHLHYNNIAMELFGAGVVMAADPGPGASYWMPEHALYYSLPPAHNTVVANGLLTTTSGGKLIQKLPMTLELCEPSVGKPSISPNISVTAASLDYKVPFRVPPKNNPESAFKNSMAVNQKRLVAMIRTGERSGFFLDVFRSKSDSLNGVEFHDYFYHNIGQALLMRDAEGKSLLLTPSAELVATGKSYGFFKDEKSHEYNNDFHGSFTVRILDNAPRVMEMWMIGSSSPRKVFTVNAPVCRAAAAPIPQLGVVPMPTVIVRQQGSAWESPFVTVYEPKLQPMDASNGIRSVHKLEMKQADPATVACVVEGKESVRDSYKVCLFQTEKKDERQVIDDNSWFYGSFGTVIMKNGRLDELFVVDGKGLHYNLAHIGVDGGGFVNAGIRRLSPNNWSYSSTGPTQVNLAFYPVVADTDYSTYKIMLDVAGSTQPVGKVTWNKMKDADNKDAWVASFTLPQSDSAVIRCVKE